MNLELRQATTADVRIIAEIERYSFPKPWDPDIFRYMALHPRGAPTTTGSLLHMIVLAQGQDIISYAVWEEKCNEGHLMNLAVAPQHRNKGFGKLILRGIVDNMRQKGIVRLELEVRENNAIARRLYEGEGMMPAGRVEGFYGATDAIIYSLDL